MVPCGVPQALRRDERWARTGARCSGTWRSSAPTACWTLPLQAAHAFGCRADVGQELSSTSDRRRVGCPGIGNLQEEDDMRDSTRAGQTARWVKCLVGATFALACSFPV